MTDTLQPDRDGTSTRLPNGPDRRERGKLTIFLGYAAGVGKTDAMLSAAHRRLAEGVELVVAYIDTHGRPETEALLSGLERLPSRQVGQPETTRPQLDLDAVLARRPELALVDKLAHTNPPGSRHLKRYQDVLELLAAGIDVYSTLNIQQLASLTDVVARITGLTEQETVPDRLLDEAHEIELVDLPVDELLRRFEAGKVPLPEPEAQSRTRFFRPGNLAALRELALRRAADRIDEQLRGYMQRHAIVGPWPAGERLLVCVSPSPLSERLVRAARRLAGRLNAEWFALYVETPGQARLSEAARDRLAHNLQLAEALGARTMSVTGQSVAEAIVAFARMHNIARIVAGKPLRPRWTDLLRGSIVDQIIRRSGDLDIYVISGAAEEASAPAERPEMAGPPRRWRRYLQSAGLVALVTLLGFPLRPFIQPTNLVMLYLLAVVLTALWLGRRPAMLASFLSVIAFNLVFVPPYYTYAVRDTQYLLTFGALLIVGIVISTLTARARDQARAARRREAQTATLYDLSRDLAAALAPAEIAQIVAIHLDRTLGCRAVLLLPGREGLRPCLPAGGFTPSEAEQAAARWVFEGGQQAGRGTGTLAEVDYTYLPLKAAQQVVGVLGVSAVDTAAPLAAEGWRLLESFAHQTAQAIRRVQLGEEARQAQLLRETEKLQTALLNSISHDLRTPLASITGSLSSLRDDAPFLTEEGRQLLVTTAWEQADRLNNLVGNLLQMTRLEAGALRLKPTLCDVQDLIGASLEQLGHRLDERPVEIDLPPDLSPVAIDFVLLVQVLVNLLDNALKYSPPGAPITLRAATGPTEFSLQVIDEGIGIPEEDLERIFQKFYRVKSPRSDAGGTGLGLSISRGIMEAHQGRIWAERRAGGGTIFTLALPLQPGETERTT